MTRDELKKRLVKIQGRPLDRKAEPIESGRRGSNNIEVSQEEASKFDDFFGFEEELSEMESARNQVERLEKRRLLEEKLVANSDPISDSKIEDENLNDEEESFLLWDIDIEDDVEEESFLVIEEEPVEDLELETNIITEESTDNAEEERSPKKSSFKFCVYIKDDETQCKRQAPKKSDYCSAHRKILAGTK